MRPEGETGCALIRPTREKNKAVQAVAPTCAAIVFTGALGKHRPGDWPLDALGKASSSVIPASSRVKSQKGFDRGRTDRAHVPTFRHLASQMHLRLPHRAL
jgi:hypothetical protein